MTLHGPARSAGGPIERLPPDDPSLSAQPAGSIQGSTPRPDATPRSAPRKSQAPPARPPVAVRFSTAAAALRYLGALTAASADTDVRFFRNATEWWVQASAEPDLAHSIARSCSGGQVHWAVDHWFRRDRGFGPPPAHGPSGVDSRTFARMELLDLVRAGGLSPTSGRPGPLSEAMVLLPGFALDALVRRGLNLGLDIHYRTVRLHSLFPTAAPGTKTPSQTVADPDLTTLVEVALSSERRPIPPALLTAATRIPLSVVCRPVRDPLGDTRLLIQYRMTAPLPDHQLAVLNRAGTWVLADAAFGCWRLEPVNGYQPAAALVVPTASFAILDQQPLGEYADTTPPVLRLVPARRPGQRVDAVLLDSTELRTVPLLLAGHPLAEIAIIVEGADHHLLLAPGGILEDLAIGLSLTCIGPGPLYIPLGRGLSPHLPPAARRNLFQADSDHAIVILDGHALRFFLNGRRPAWYLWATVPPQVSTQLPAGTATALRALEQQPAEVAQRPGGEQGSSAVPQPSHLPEAPEQIEQPEQLDTWRAEALNAELTGDLRRAAQLHRRHNEPLRAARLFERAARESDPDPWARS